MAAATALEQSGLNPDRLTVEITESSVSNSEAAADLQVMTRLGIQLTVDDVGADWSILNNLRNCVVNTMKIDASLIDDITAGGKSRTTVETIMKLCRSLGICTVAEAVETAEQVEVLREIGVEIAQGYFFSAPHVDGRGPGLAAMVPRPGSRSTRRCCTERTFHRRAPAGSVDRAPTAAPLLTPRNARRFPPREPSPHPSGGEQWTSARLGGGSRGRSPS